MTEPASPARPLRRWAAVGWAVLFLVLGAALTVALGTLLVLLTGPMQDPELTSSVSMLTGTFAGIVGFGFATWLIGRRVLRLGWDDLRWKPGNDIARSVGIGVLLGVVPAAIAILVAVPIAGAEITPDPTTPGTYLGQVVLTFVVLLPAALFEEIVFRGVGQVVLARTFGRLPAIIGLSTLFALAHIANDNSTVLGLVNIGLAGVLLGLVFYLPGGIWTAWGAHFGWNATLAAFDAPVSGLPFPIPAINYLPGQPSWLTGGAFGPEGGLLASIVLLGTIVLTYRMLNHSKESV